MSVYVDDMRAPYGRMIRAADPRLAALYVVARAKLDYIAMYGS